MLKLMLIINIKYQFFRELRSVGVKVTPSHHGYYLFPDFEVVREGLAKTLGKDRADITSKDLCDQLLSVAGVAVKCLLQRILS